MGTLHVPPHIFLATSMQVMSRCSETGLHQQQSILYNPFITFWKSQTASSSSSSSCLWAEDMEGVVVAADLPASICSFLFSVVSWSLSRVNSASLSCSTAASCWTVSRRVRTSNCCCSKYVRCSDDCDEAEPTAPLSSNDLHNVKRIKE